MHGCEHHKKKFTVFPGKRNPDEPKICFKDDCRNEGEACKTCVFLNMRFTNYQYEAKVLIK